MDDRSISLTAGFPPASEEDWRALVDKTLAGASFEKRLVSRTYDGLEIQPLYTSRRPSTVLAEALRRRPRLDEDRAWDIRVGVDHPDPAAANAAALGELEEGATSLLVRVDATGAQGVAIASASDLERTLQDVLFDLAPIALDAGFQAPRVGGWLYELAQAKTLKPHLQLHLDPIGVFAQTGTSPGPIEEHIALAAETACKLHVDSAFLASGQALHETGASEAMEIGFMAAVGLAYVKAMIDQGASADAALDKICLGLCADADYFTTIAKLRAARTVWARISSAISSKPVSIKIECRSSRRMLSQLDPWVNMLRLTSAAFGASIGGADAVYLDAFTQPIGRPTPFARRNARNIQLVLMEEAHLGLVADPAGGAWFLETFTEEIARAAWAAFQEIETCGGAVVALKSGRISQRASEARTQREGDISKRKTGLVGATEFANIAERPVEVETIDGPRFAKLSESLSFPGADSCCPALTPWRASEAFEKIRSRTAAIEPRPCAYLATLGSLNDYSGRVGFARNVLAAGGVDCVVGPVDDYQPCGFPIAVICGSDTGYDQGALEALQTLKTKGAPHVYLAGRPRPSDSELNAGGLEGCLFAGADIRAALDILITQMDVGSPGR